MLGHASAFGQFKLAHLLCALTGYALAGLTPVLKPASLLQLLQVQVQVAHLSP